MTSNWQLALTLVERRERLDMLTSSDGDLAELRLRMLRDQYDLEDFDDALDSWLAHLSLTSEQLLLLLGESTESLVGRFTQEPEWSVLVGNALDRWGSAATEEAPADFRGMLRPFSEFVAQGIREDAPEGSLPASDEFLDAFSRSGLDMLVTLSGPTLVLLLNVARLEGSLQGETSEERFASFCRSFRDRAAYEDLFSRYPGLARVIGQTCLMEIEAKVEFLCRLSEDWSDIGRTFGIDPEALIEEVSLGDGDTHRGGRSVATISLTSGQRLLYKPRSLTVDREYNHLIDRLNRTTPDLALKHPRILERAGYGWVEFIEHYSCSSNDEVASYYRELGALMAVAHVLGTTDLHFENIIAAGAHPVFIDLETLLQPELPRSYDIDDSYLAADREFSRSVLETGLLPNTPKVTDDRQAIDWSGISLIENQVQPVPQQVVSHPDRDDARYEPHEATFDPAQNLPVFQGRKRTIQGYGKPFVQGFTAAYESLLEQRDEILLRREGILARLSGSHIRTVLLATRAYGELLANIVHPDYLINGLAVDRFTSVLWRRRAGQIKEAAQQAALEIKQIVQGDVPHFSTEISSVAIVDQSGSVAVHAEKSAAQRAMDRIKGMGKADLERQTWYIRASVATLTMGHVAQMGMTVGSGIFLPGYPSDESTSGEENTTDRLVRQIADHLLRISFSGEGTDWMGLESDDDVHWRVSPSGLDAYSGSTGIGLFYLYAGDQLNVPRYTDIAQRMVDARARMVEGYTRPDVPVLERGVDVGLFSVMGAASYFLAHAVCRTGQERARLAVGQMVSFFERAHITDENIDIVMGSAGLITALLSCEEVLADGRSIELAIRYADHLLGQATQMGNGRVAWYAGNEIRPLTGHSPATHRLLTRCSRDRCGTRQAQCGSPNHTLRRRHHGRLRLRALDERPV